MIAKIIEPLKDFGLEYYLDSNQNRQLLYNMAINTIVSVIDGLFKDNGDLVLKSAFDDMFVSKQFAKLKIADDISISITLEQRGLYKVMFAIKPIELDKVILFYFLIGR